MECVDTHICISCGANWSEGAFNPQCEECGEGALELACPICEGRCGALWERAIADSHHDRLAHWIGNCLLPMAQQLALLTRKGRQAL